MSQALYALGWSQFFEEQQQRWNDPERIPARIVAEHRGGYEVASAGGTGFARLSGRFRHEAEEGFPGVGDWVALDAGPGPDRTALIERLFARRTAFLRGAAGREARVQVIAANVDVVFVVCGLDEDFNVRRIERYLARVWASGAEPVVVLSKADLAEDSFSRVAEVEEHAPGVAVLPICALQGEGLEAIRARIAQGKTAALVGSSGAGKSTLVNALLGEERMATGDVRADDGRGRHTTTHRELVLLPEGGLLLDTPGMRELQLSDSEGLETAFEDVESFAAGCRFSDCCHGDEPGCAVRAAVEAGELDAERLEHYLQLKSEARSYERRHDQRLRREDERAWGRLIASAKKQVKHKHGW
jgi:ribosome biogenesis GTPase